MIPLAVSVWSRTSQTHSIIPVRTDIAKPAGRSPVFLPQTSETMAAVARVVIVGGSLKRLSMRSGPLNTADERRRSLSGEPHFEGARHPGPFQGSYHCGRSGLSNAKTSRQLVRRTISRRSSSPPHSGQRRKTSLSSSVTDGSSFARSSGSSSLRFRALRISCRYRSR